MAWRELTLFSSAVFLLAGCQQSVPTQDELIDESVDESVTLYEAPLITAETWVYRCGEKVFSLRLDQPGTARLLINGEQKELTRKIDASEAVYVADQTRLAIIGESAELTFQQQYFHNCRYDQDASLWQHARLNGVSFRAIGYGPGWQLEHYPERGVIYTGDFGLTTVFFPQPVLKIETPEGELIYSGEQDGITLRVRGVRKECVDEASGDRFRWSVALTINGRPLQGCGRKF